MYQYNNFPYNGFGMQQQQCIPKVNGIDGAKAYSLGPNSSIALFDGNSDLFFVKVTDSAGFPTIRTFRFEEVSQDQKPIEKDYVSREEMEEYVKQYISKSDSK